LPLKADRSVPRWSFFKYIRLDPAETFAARRIACGWLFYDENKERPATLVARWTYAARLNKMKPVPALEPRNAQRAAME